MTRYIAQRLLQIIPVFFLSSILIFVVIRLIPGDPAQMRLGVEGSSKEALARVREEMGLDKPLAVQYLLWLRQVASGDFGLSWRSGASAAFLLSKKLPATLWLGFSALVVGLLISLPAGIISAAKVHTWVDSLLTGVALLGVSVPSFWLGIMLILIFAVSLGWLPASGYVSPTEDLVQGLTRLIMPALTLGVQVAAPLTRFVRSGMLEVMNEEYIRSARAKGLRERLVVVRHALPNALLSVVTVLGLQIGGMLGGQFVTESVFNWPGIGSMMLDAIRQRDYGIVQAVVMFVVVGFLLVNLITDILYAALDPRIRLGAGAGS
jgi:peptide/nickel transport system permease protein